MINIEGESFSDTTEMAYRGRDLLFQSRASSNDAGINKAIKLLVRADVFEAHDTLARYYEAIGDYQEAAKWLRKVAEDPDLGEEAQQTLELWTLQRKIRTSTAPSSTSSIPKQQPTCEGQWTPASRPAPAPTVNTAGMSAKDINNQGLAADKAGDFAKGAALYLKAAEMGYMYAQNNIACCYRDGEGVQKDYAKAFYWFEKSAAQGYSEGMCSFGFCYDAGQGVPQDKAKALYWYTKAAEKGHAVGMRNLGIFYRDGISVKQDYAIAEQWFNKAIAAGDEVAKSELTKLKTKRGY